MPVNSFPGQSTPAQAIFHTPTKPDSRLVTFTQPDPLSTIPSSASNGRTNVGTGAVLPNRSVVFTSSSGPGTCYASTADATATACVRPNSSTTQTAPPKSPLASLTWEELCQQLREILGVDVGNRDRVYQKPYPSYIDSVPYPTGWRVPDFIKFNGEDSKTTWEHVSQYLAQLGEASSNEAIKIRLFSLSLTRTAFSWFSYLTVNSIFTWDQLECRFHDHFYSGDNELKLSDLTSVRQGRDEPVQLDAF